MQRSIDSFFKRTTPAAKKQEETDKPGAKKRKLVIISSDEDEVAESPQVSKSRDNKKKRTDANKTSPTKKVTLSKLKVSPQKNLKRVDPNALFGGETVRVEAKKPTKRKDAALAELEDDNINESLMDIDVDENVTQTKDNGKQQKDKTPTKSEHKSTPTKESKSSAKKQVKTNTSLHNEHESPSNESKSTHKQKKDKTPVKTEKITPTSAKKPKLTHDDTKATPKAQKKEQKTPKTKHDHEDMNSSVLSDEERHERKRMSAILYQKYKNRSSCLNPGSKEVPKGKPNCLAGLTFVISGVLESLERDEAASIIKEYGGKVMTTVGKRLKYLIVGEDAGPKKMAQAEELGITLLSEDGLFDLIRGKPVDGNNANNEEKPTTSPNNKLNAKVDIKIKKEKSISPEKKVKEHFSPKEATKQPKVENMPVKEELNNNYAKENLDKNVKTESTVKTEQKPVIKKDIDVESLAWVDKYKPKTVKDIIGQQGAASNVAKLTNWLSKWYTNHDGKKKLQKPNPWAKNDDGSFYKAALLSGPPGIGKTTTATLVCKELGFDTVEFNASDTRSKRLLKEQVAELLSNKSLYGFCHGNAQAVTKKHVLIMDEVDGMAGNEDRGGIQELIGLIKESAVPIICMCNDRNHQKMRSLVNYCYDLRFNRPRLEQIKGCVMSIICKEKFKLDAKKVEEIITATNHDIRQTINHISLLSAGKELDLKTNESQNGDKIAEKDLKLGPWEVVRKVFSADEHKRMSLHDKCDLFFNDYSLGPLFVQQNYLQVSPAGARKEVMNKVALTADALSLGDLVDKRIRSNNAWSLLPTQAVFSSVLPGEYMCGHFTGQINFPGWLGKYSRSNKRSRLAQEIHDHTRIRTSASRQSIRLDYAPYLLANIVRPLKEQGMDGVTDSLNVLKEYHLLREDIESLVELTAWPGKKGLMDAVDGRVKAALTRTYNKEVLAYTYSAAVGIKKKKAEAIDESDMYGIEDEAETAIASDEEKDDDVEHDALIKTKKKTSAAATNTTKASTSKTKKTTAAVSKAKATTSKAKK